MAIYRGAGGSGNSNQDSYLNAVTAQAVLATDAANSTTADVVLTNADVVLTHADVVSTSADVTQTNADAATTGQDAIDTAADVVLAEADKVQTGLDRIATAADLVATNADVVLAEADKVQTGLDAVATAADKVATNADVVLTNADVVLAEADKVQTGLDAVATAADKVATNADVVLAEADKVQTGLDRIATAADVVLTNADVATTANKLPLAGGAMTGPITTNSTFDGVDIAARDAVVTINTAVANAALPKAGGAMTGNITGLTALDVTGTVVADGLVVDGLVDFGSGANTGQLGAESGGVSVTAAGKWRVRTNGGTVRQQIESNGDISFYEDTGTTPKFFWDASAESLGIGAAPTGVSAFGANKFLELGGATVPALLLRPSGSTCEQTILGANDGLLFSATGAAAHANNKIRFFTTNINSSTSPQEAMRIDSSGNVGIGTSSPESRLSVLQSALDDNALVLPMASGAANGNYTSIRGKYGIGNEYARGEVRFGVESFQTGSGFLAFATGTNAATERLRIDSSGNVGIGVSSPSSYAFNDAAKLVVSNTAGNSTITVASGTTSNGYLAFADGTSGTDRYTGAIQYNHSTNHMQFNTNAGAERMRIDSSGNVSIGHTTSTGSKFAICDGANSQIQFFPEISTDTNLTQHYDPTASVYINAETRAASHVFKTGTTERMRIDSSGNVLVGQSSTTVPGVGNTTAGSAIGAAGYIFVSKSGDTPAHFNRNTNDGDIITLRKDGTTVGSIGTHTGDLTIGTNDTGLQFYDAGNAISPKNVSTNADRDAAVDLGISSVRFKDLYLSGGVDFGAATGGTGTSTSNKLDDYEEGTFTPTISTDGTIVYSNSIGKYVKVGNLVTIYIDIIVTSWSGNTSNPDIQLPFTSNGQWYAGPTVWTASSTFTGTGATFTGYVGGSAFSPYKTISGNSEYYGLINTNVTGRLSFSLTYQTT